MDEYVLCNDWGGYDYDNLQVEKLQSEGGARVFISQLGGLGTDKLVKRAKAIGQLIGLYGWNSALNTAQSEIDAFSFYIDRLKPEIFIMDFEHYWSKWSQYWDAIGKLLPWANVEKMDPQKISDHGQLVMEGIVKRWAGKYLLAYSAPWFTQGYSPMSINWLKNYPYAGASYVDYGCQKYTCSWQQIRNGDIKVYDYKTKSERWDNLRNFVCGTPDPRITAEMWQFSSRVMVPGEYYAYDWIRFAGSIDKLRVKCGLQPESGGPTIEQLQAKIALLDAEKAAWLTWYAGAPKGA